MCMGPDRGQRAVQGAAARVFRPTASPPDESNAAGMDALRVTPGALDERGLVEASARGDAAAFDALVARWVDRLFAVAYRILRDLDAADDATQDALVIAWRDIRGLRDPDAFESWIYRLLVRVCYRHAGRRRRDAVRVVDVEDIEIGRADHVDSVANRDRIERGFARLTTEQRTVLVLFHYLGRSHAEIGDILNLPEGTVASRLHYATKALRAAVSADDRLGGALS